LALKIGPVFWMAESWKPVHETEHNALTADEARRFASEWIEAWNAHDLERILSHYDEAVELTSPTAARLLGLPGGTIRGKTDVRGYFQKGLEAYPGLRFQLEDVLSGVRSVVLYYTNQNGTHTGEFMEFAPSGKVIRVVANYSA
jgi:ketosteroid isomerase-like protein